MEFEGTSATFANGVEGGDNDLTLNFSQTATVDGYSNIANFISEGAVNLSGNFTTRRASRSTKATLLLVVIPNLSQRLLSSPMASQAT